MTAEARGQGIGRQLIQHALEYLRREGMAYAVIETMEGNEAGQTPLSILRIRRGWQADSLRYDARPLIRRSHLICT